MAIEILKELQDVHYDPKALMRAGSRFIKPTGEPQKGYMWEVEIIDPTLDSATGFAKFLGSVNPIKKDLKFYAQAVTIPESSVDMIRRDYLGQSYFVPGRKVPGNGVNITFWDDQDLYAFQYFQQWFDYLSTPELGKSAEPEDVQRDIIIRLKDTTDLFTNMAVTLKNALVSSVGSVSLSYDNSNPLEFQVSLTYNWKFVGEHTSEDY